MGRKGEKKKVYRNAPDREECGLYKPTLWDKPIRIPFVYLPVPFTFSVHSNLCLGLPPRVRQIFQYHKTSLFALKKGSTTTVFSCLPFEAEPEDQNCPNNTKKCSFEYLNTSTFEQNDFIHVIQELMDICQHSRLQADIMVYFWEMDLSSNRQNYIFNVLLM